MCGVDQAMLAQQLAELGLTASSLLGAVAETPKGASRYVPNVPRPTYARILLPVTGDQFLS